MKEKKVVHSGKPVALWFDQDDRDMLAKVGSVLFAKGIKPSSSLIVRAALRRVQFDKAFYEFVDDLVANDGRKIRHQK